MFLWQLGSILCSFVLSVRSQSADGSFSSPGGATQVYTAGALVNLTWESKYDSVNMYLVPHGNYFAETTVTINYVPRWYEWTVNGGGNNLSTPFFFRIVNATGTEEQQVDGGFFSAEFWIIPDAALSTASSTPNSTLRTTLSSLVSPTIMTTTSSAMSTPSSTSTLLSSPTTATSSSRLSEGTKVGLGAGIGVGVGIVLLVGAGLFFFWRRWQKKKAIGSSLALTKASQDGGYSQSYYITDQSGFEDHHQCKLQDSEHRPPVEVPGWNEPQELPAYHDRPKPG